MKMSIEQARAELAARKHHSAWDRGVNDYAKELLDSLEEAITYNNGKEPETRVECKEALLNGASDWAQYNWGGSALIYDGDIAERLCCPSKLKKTRNGERRPNSREEWLDVQARALHQASRRIVNLLF